MHHIQMISDRNGRVLVPARKVGKKFDGRRGWKQVCRGNRAHYYETGNQGLRLDGVYGTPPICGAKILRLHPPIRGQNIEACLHCLKKRGDDVHSTG